MPLTMLLLACVFSRLITENDRSQVHVLTREVPRILQETLMLLKPFMECILMCLLYGLQDNLYFLANMIPISPVLPPTLWDIEIIFEKIKK